MRTSKGLVCGLGFAGLAVAAVIYWGLLPTVERAYEPAGEYVPPTLAELDAWKANDVRRHFESRGIVLPEDIPGVTLANGRYFSRQEIYGNPLVNEIGLGRLIYRPSQEKKTPIDPEGGDGG